MHLTAYSRLARIFAIALCCGLALTLIAPGSSQAGPADSLRVIVSGVRNIDDFVRVFKRTPQFQSELDDAIFNTIRAERSGYRILVPTSGMTMAQQVRAEYNAAAANGAAAVALVGHNENGIFYLADGSSLRLAETAYWQGAGTTVPVLLSCQSRVKVGNHVITIPDKITYGVGLDTAEYLGNNLRSRGLTVDNVTWQDIQSITDAGLASAISRERQIVRDRVFRRVEVIGGLGGSAIVVTVVYDRVGA